MTSPTLPRPVEAREEAEMVATRIHCQRCGCDVGFGDWEEHVRKEAWAAVNNNPELFVEVGHE